MDNNKKITITINDREYKIDPGQTIMQAADEGGFRIPRLCYHPRLSIEGACRVCIVEVEGMRNLVRLVLLSRSTRGWSCTRTRPRSAQSAATSSSCCSTTTPRTATPASATATASCSAWPTPWASASGYFDGRAEALREGLSGAAVIRDPDKCILCGRCVRMCGEVQEVAALGQVDRGLQHRRHAGVRRARSPTASASAAGSASTSARPPRSSRRTTPGLF